MKKSLTFRTLIEPYEVYPKGVTEWEALDEIKNITSPNQMLWSLIYRKLKGNRGNTMITIYESERLFKLIRDKNNRNTLNGNKFTFNHQNQEIIVNTSSYNYSGRQLPINIFPRLAEKYKSNKSFEPHLQAYVVQNIGRGINKSLDECLIDSNYNIEWIGNEVYCGVGMQKIDVMISLVNKKDIQKRMIVPIELKCIEATNTTVNQIERYIEWLKQYYLPNRISDIQPVLISRKINNKDSSKYNEIRESFLHFNKKNKGCIDLRYIEFEISNGGIYFQRIKY